jgi:hypothetical protein
MTSAQPTLTARVCRRTVSVMSGRVRSAVCMASLVAVAACGSEPAPVAEPASRPVDSVPNLGATSPQTVAAPSTSSGKSVDTISVGEPVRIDLDRYQIDGVLPHDAGPDPMGEFTPPDFVIDSRRWMTDCCWLTLTVQSERPLHPDEQLVETVQANGLEWTFYDTGDEGFLQIAVTAVDDISISIATQQRFDGDESTPEALETVRAMVDTVEVRER